MKAETRDLIMADIGFITMHNAFNRKEVAFCLNTYLFALSRHGVIESDEYKELADIVVETLYKKEA